MNWILRAKKRIVSLIIGMLLFTGCGSFPLPPSDPKVAGEEQRARRTASTPAQASVAAAITGCSAPEGTGLKAVGDARYFWTKRHLSVGFAEGDQAFRDKILEIASSWSEGSSIRFSETTFQNADIRVSFEQRGEGAGNWSYIGNMAQRIESRRPTMNLQLSPRNSEEDIRKIVLHEFGHAIGLWHEHLHPSVTIDWNRAELYRIYAEKPNEWPASKVEENILSPIRPTRNIFMTQYDRTSVMHYPITEQMILSGDPLDWNKGLSPSDRAWVAFVYPPKI